MMEFLIILLAYMVLTHLIAEHLGTKRTIGYGKSVLFSILLFPVGWIITVLSPRVEGK